MHDRKMVWFAALAAAGTCGQAAAQSNYRMVEEPRWLTLKLNEVSTGVYAEGNYEDASFRGSGRSATYERIFIGPLLGVNVNGSIYHPNLFRFLLMSDGAYGWGDQETRSTTSTISRQEFYYLGRVAANGVLFANKPFRTTVYGDYDHTHRDYDFFNRVIVDGWRYGARSGYSAGPIPFSVSYAHYDEEISGFSTPSEASGDTVGLNARHQRDRGSTTLDYNFDQYTRSDLGRTGVGSDHSVTLSDSETFGKYDQIRFHGNSTYLRRDNIGTKSEEFNNEANLTAEHRHNLSSFYNVLYNRYSSGTFQSDSFSGHAELRHRLYDSLTSSLQVEGSDYENSDSFSDGYVRRYGVGIGLGYVKQLGAKARLSINNTAWLYHVDQKSITTIENERHVFSTGPGGDVVSLNQPFVDLSHAVVVTDGTEVLQYIEGYHYELIQNGSRVSIRRLSRPGDPSAIPDTGVILVDYQVVPTSAGEYDLLTDTFRIRLDLWNNLVGVYGRMSLFRNDAPEQMRIQEISSYAAGVEYNWRWLNAGAEYEIYDSTDSSYRTARLFQSLNFRLDSMSTLGFGFTESWTDYETADRQEQNYRFISRYRVAFSSRLAASAEGGVALRRSSESGAGLDRDETLATFRPGVDWKLGRTTIKAGYEFEYDLYQRSEERMRHMFFLRCKRIF